MIRKLSKKRAAENRRYLKLRVEFLTEHPLCQAGLSGCRINADSIHHQRGRIGDKLTDVSNFLAVCHWCHTYIEHEPVLAREKGFSKSRLCN